MKNRKENQTTWEEAEEVKNWKLGPWVLRTDGQLALRSAVSSPVGGQPGPVSNLERGVPFPGCTCG